MMRRLMCGGFAPWMLGAAVIVTAAAIGCGRGAHDPDPVAQTASPADSGIVQLDAEAMRRTGIVVEPAGAAEIDVTLQMPGEIRPDPQKVLEVRPRFAGVVRELRKAIGQPVRRGDVLAMIESNESLTNYAVTSSLAGRVIARPVAPGQSVTSETALFTVADLSTVWVEVGVYPNQIGRIRTGQSAHVVSTTDSSRAQDGVVSYVAPMLESESRVALARVVLSNAPPHWEPGMFVNVVVTIDHATVPVAVPDDAVVRTGDETAVFVAQGSSFRRQVVETGRSDGRHTEILSGLEVGTPIAARNAYVLKSELEKEAEPE